MVQAHCKKHCSIATISQVNIFQSFFTVLISRSDRRSLRIWKAVVRVVSGLFDSRHFGTLKLTSYPRFRNASARVFPTKKGVHACANKPRSLFAYTPDVYPPEKLCREPVHRSRATSAARDWLGKLKEVVSFRKLETEHAGVDVKRCSAFVAASPLVTPSRVLPRREYYSRGSTCHGRIFHRVFTWLVRACTSCSNFSNGSTGTYKVFFFSFSFFLSFYKGWKFEKFMVYLNYSIEIRLKCKIPLIFLVTHVSYFFVSFDWFCFIVGFYYARKMNHF